jgi:hypothetical protein
MEGKGMRLPAGEARQGPGFTIRHVSVREILGKISTIKLTGGVLNAI